MTDQKYLRKLINTLRKLYPEAECSLDFRNPVEMLISTILSAQCTDARVNIITKDLFKRFKKVEDYANADLREIKKYIKSAGFYNNKAKNIKLASQKIVEEFNGKVPETMESLITLPGVGRKTANIVLSNSFGKAEGIAVDTHVKRLSYRLGLTKKQDPDKIEQDLLKVIPKKDWLDFNHMLVFHGRAYCQAITPSCSTCPLNTSCPKKGVTRSK